MKTLERIKTAMGCALFQARLYYPQPPKARNPRIWAIIMVPDDSEPFGYMMSFDSTHMHSLYQAAKTLARDRGWGCRLESYSADSEDG